MAKSRKHKPASAEPITSPSTESLSPQKENSSVAPSGPPNDSTPSNRHAFQTNSLDHCETPLVAYQHIAPVLELIAAKLNIQPSKLRIYDPYYCDGSMKRHLSSLGYHRIIHENVDFYQAIHRNSIPDHDVLLTNPPYSDDHIDKLLQYVQSHSPQKPFLLLMPNWVARKSEYKSLLKAKHFFLSPTTPYTYMMPSWNAKPKHVDEDGKTTPYLSSWYISMGEDEVVLDKMEKKLDGIAKRQETKDWVVAKTVKGLKWKIQKVNKKR